MSLEIPEEKHGNTIYSAHGDTVNISGEIYDLDPAEFLKPFLKKIIKNMDKKIIFNFTELEFINSSTIGCFIYFISERKKNSKVIFQFDNKKPWLQKSFEVLQSFDEKNIQFLYI